MRVAGPQSGAMSGAMEVRAVCDDGFQAELVLDEHCTVQDVLRMVCTVRGESLEDSRSLLLAVPVGISSPSVNPTWKYLSLGVKISQVLTSARTLHVFGCAGKHNNSQQLVALATQLSAVAQLISKAVDGSPVGLAQPVTVVEKQNDTFIHDSFSGITDIRQTLDKFSDDMKRKFQAMLALPSISADAKVIITSARDHFVAGDVSRCQRVLNSETPHAILPFEAFVNAAIPNPPPSAPNAQEKKRPLDSQNKVTASALNQKKPRVDVSQKTGEVLKVAAAMPMAAAEVLKVVAEAPKAVVEVSMAVSDVPKVAAEMSMAVAEVQKEVEASKSAESFATANTSSLPVTELSVSSTIEEVKRAAGAPEDKVAVPVMSSTRSRSHTASSSSSSDSSDASSEGEDSNSSDDDTSDDETVAPAATGQNTSSAAIISNPPEVPMQAVNERAEAASSSEEESGSSDSESNDSSDSESSDEEEDTTQIVATQTSSVDKSPDTVAAKAAATTADSESGESESDDDSSDTDSDDEAPVAASVATTSSNAAAPEVAPAASGDSSSDSESSDDSSPDEDQANRLTQLNTPVTPAAPKLWESRVSSVSKTPAALKALLTGSVPNKPPSHFLPEPYRTPSLSQSQVLHDSSSSSSENESSENSSSGDSDTDSEEEKTVSPSAPTAAVASISDPKTPYMLSGAIRNVTKRQMSTRSSKFELSRSPKVSLGDAIKKGATGEAAPAQAKQAAPKVVMVPKNSGGRGGGRGGSRQARK